MEHQQPQVANTRRRSKDADGFPRRIDISRFTEIGRINRPSGAKSWDDYGRRIALLDELYDQGKLDLLREFAAGRVKMDELMRLKRQHRLDSGARELRLKRPLFATFDTLVQDMGSKKKTRDGYQSLFLRMVRLSVPALNEQSAVIELERQDWKAVRRRWKEDGASGQTWNNFIIMLGSFLTHVLGRKEHPDRLRIMEQLKRAPRAAGRTPDASPMQLAAVLQRMPRRTGAAALTLLVTGIRMSEYLNLDPEIDLAPNQQALRVAGESDAEGDDDWVQAAKNVQSQGLRYVAEGFWPIVEWSVRNKPSYITLRRHWCWACDAVGLGVLERTKDDPNHRWPQSFKYSGMTMHDLRHSYAQIVSAAGMPLSQLRHALGHGDEQSTARYAAQRAGREAAQLAGAAFGDALVLTALWPDEEAPEDGDLDPGAGAEDAASELAEGEG